MKDDEFDNIFDLNNTEIEFFVKSTQEQVWFNVALILPNEYLELVLPHLSEKMRNKIHKLTKNLENHPTRESWNNSMSNIASKLGELKRCNKL